MQGGRKVWLLARLPENYQILGDEVTPYLVFSNAHDGSGAIKVAMTPVRVVCQNTLNLALHDAKRIWSTNHTGDMQTKLSEAKKTLLLAEHYMDKLNDEANELSGISMSDKKVMALYGVWQLYQYHFLIAFSTRNPAPGQLEYLV